MKRSRATPLWPYLGVVWCLFFLSLAAPRTWRSIAVDPGAIEVAALTLPENGNMPGDHLAGARATLVSRYTVDRAAIAAPVARIAASRPTLRPATAGETKDGTAGPSSAADSQPLELTDPGYSHADERAGRTESADQAESSDQAEESRILRLPHVDTSSSPLESAESLWTVPTTLLAELDDLAMNPAASDWAIKTSARVRRLTASPPADSKEVTQLLAELAAAADEASRLADSLRVHEDRTAVRRAGHSLRRRVEIWQLAPQIDERGTSDVSSVAGRGPELARRIADVRSLVGDSRQGRAWNEYLMLDSLSELANRVDATSDADRRTLARRVLARLSHPRLTSRQDRFVSQQPVVALTKELQRWATQPVGMHSLLAQMEQYELTHSAVAANQLAESCCYLAWAADPDLQQLSRQLNENYRNANLRFAVAEKLINRLLPEEQNVGAEVYDNILGADVEGYSWTSTELGVRLIPDRTQIRAELQARGYVDSDTAATSGPATFHSSGNSAFTAHKLFLVSPHDGVRSTSAVASAESDSDLVGMDTSFDRVPLLRSMVRRMALSQHEKSRGDALWEVENRVASTASERLDDEAEQRLRDAKSKLAKRVFEPMNSLSLEPTPVQMYSTDRRAIVRMRLAADQQLAANTPRPRAPADSLLSMQLHESAINNATENLKLDGRDVPLTELYQIVAARVSGLDDPSLVVVPDDIPRNARVKMADKDAIRVQCDDDEVRLTISIAEAHIRRTDIPDVRVHAIYKPEVKGLQVQLVRDAGVQVETDNRLTAGTSIVLRSAFARLLSRNRPIELVRRTIVDDPRLKDLQVNQMVIDDGWIGLAIGPRRPGDNNRLAKQATVDR